MMVVSISLLIPTVMSAATPPEYDDTNNTLTLSHATAIVLFMLFISYLFFRFRTHEVIFRRVPYDGVTANQTIPIIGGRLGLLSSPWVFRLIFISASLCIIACGRYIIHSIDVSIKRMRITKSFVGLVLLPLMGNIAKSVAIVTTCRTRMLDLAIRAVMSNVLDTLLFIAPFLVLLGWIVNQPMDLEFGLFEAIVLLLAIIVMTILLQHGKTTYFEGAMLMGT
jgi:Ca2+:H+ antiporter